MINKIVNQKNFNAIYFASSIMNMQVLDNNITFQKNDSELIKEYQLSESDALILKDVNIEEIEKTNIIVNFFCSCFAILFFLIFFIINEDFLEFIIVMFVACYFCVLLFSALLNSYFNKIKQLFDILKNYNEIKEENPELFTQLEYIQGFRNIISYFILISFLAAIFFLFVIYLVYKSKAFNDNFQQKWSNNLNMVWDENECKKEYFYNRIIKSKYNSYALGLFIRTEKDAISYEWLKLKLKYVIFFIKSKFYLKAIYFLPIIGYLISAIFFTVFLGMLSYNKINKVKLILNKKEKDKIQ